MQDISANIQKNQILKVTAKSPVPVSTTKPTNKAGTGNVPKKLLSISAAQSPTIVQNKTMSEVTINFTRDTSDSNYDHTNVWVQYYKGSTNPVLVASGRSSPFDFLLESTGDTVRIYLQPVGTTGAVNDLSYAISTTLKLSGVVSAPPAPTITQNLVASPLGYQFTFTQVVLSAGTQDVIDSYKVYRNTSNSTSGATVIHTYKHDQSNAGASIVVVDSTPNGVQYYYWVSSVNTAGLESTLQAAQSGAVTPSTPITGVGPQAVLSPAQVTAAIDWGVGGTISSLTQGADVPVQGSFQFDVYAAPAGGLVDVCLAASGGTTGYVFRFEGRNGQAPYILRINGTGAGQYTILSTGPTNSSTLTGWHHVDVRIAGAQYDLFIDGKWTCSAVDTTYTPTGHLYYGYTGSTGMVIAPSSTIQKTTDNLPNGTSSWLPNANTAFAQGTQVVDSVSTVANTYASAYTGNSCSTPPCCVSWQVWIDSGKAIGVGLLASGGNTGYSFVLNGSNGSHIAYCEKVTNLSSGTTVAIGTNYTATNSGTQPPGWYDCHAFISDTGLINFYVNGKLAVTANDTTYTPNGTVKYWGGSSNSGKLGPAPAVRVGSTFLNGQGNLSTGTLNSFTYTSATASIKWTWSAFTLYAADGSSVSVAANAGGTNFTGLSSSTTYYFGFYVNVATGVCTVVKSDVSSGTAQFSAQFIQQTLNGDGNSSLYYNVAAATTSSGTGGGSGGGGGGGCFSPNTLLACGTPISEATPGQLVEVEKDNGDRVLRPVAKVLVHENYKSLMCDMGDGELVTPEHHLKTGDGWAEADTVFETSKDMWTGTVYDLQIQTEAEDEHNFVLQNGRVAHNKIF